MEDQRLRLRFVRWRPVALVEDGLNAAESFPVSTRHRAWRRRTNTTAVSGGTNASSSTSMNRLKPPSPIRKPMPVCKSTDQIIISQRMRRGHTNAEKPISKASVNSTEPPIRTWYSQRCSAIKNSDSRNSHDCQGEKFGLPIVPKTASPLHQLRPCSFARPVTRYTKQK